MFSFLTFLFYYESQRVYPSVNDYDIDLGENYTVDYFITRTNITFILHNLRNCKVIVSDYNQTLYTKDILAQDGYFFGNHYGRIRIKSLTNESYINFSLIYVPKYCNILHLSSGNKTSVSFSPTSSHFNSSLHYCFIISPFYYSESELFFSSNPLKKFQKSSIDYIPSIATRTQYFNSTTLKFRDNESRTSFISLHLRENSLKQTHFSFRSKALKCNYPHDYAKKSIKTIVYTLPDSLYINCSEGESPDYTYYGDKPSYIFNSNFTYFPDASISPSLISIPSVIHTSATFNEDANLTRPDRGENKSEQIYKSLTIALAFMSIVCIVIIVITLTTVFWTRKKYKDTVCSVIMLDESSSCLTSDDPTV